MNGPTTANRYYLQDEWGEILMEVDNFMAALREKARLEVVEGKRVRIIDRQCGDVLENHK